MTGSHIGKIERGETRCERALAERLDDLLGTQGALPALWDALVVNAAFPIWFDWPTVESEAVLLQTYQCVVVYGLLQTEEYARALHPGGDRSCPDLPSGPMPPARPSLALRSCHKEVN